MKLSTFTLLAIVGVSTVLATGAPSQLDGLKEDCEDDQPKGLKHHGVKTPGLKYHGLKHHGLKSHGHKGKHHGPKHTTFHPETPVDPDTDGDAPDFPPKTGSPLPPVDHLPPTGSVPSNTTPKVTTPKVTTPKGGCDPATTEAACKSSVIAQLIG
jgi:hypothetical protein